MMKPLLGVLAVVMLCLGTAACGGSSKGPAGGASVTVVSDFSTHKNDRDNDGDHNDDDGKVLQYGHPADPVDHRTSVTLAKRYLASAAAGDGAEACSLLAPLLAESVVEQDGHSPATRGKTCAAVMSKLFRLEHRLLAGKSASLQVIAVRIKGDRMLAVLDFPEVPEVRQIEERHVGGTWKVFALLDGIIE